MSAAMIAGLGWFRAAPPSRRLIASALVLPILAVILALVPLSWATAGVVVAALGISMLIQPATGLLLIAATIPWGGLAPLPIGVAGVVDLLVVMVTIAWLARGVAQRQINVEAPALVWPLIFFVWIVAASLTQATSWRDGLPEWLKWAEFAVLYIVSLQVLRPRSARLLVATLLLAGVSQAALGAYQFTRQVGPEGFILMGRFMRAYGTLNQPNPYAGYLGYLAPVAVSLTLWSVGRWWRTRQVNQLIACLAGMGATVALIAGIFMSWSRGAWLGLAVSLLVVVGLRSRRTVLVTSMVLAALIIVIVVFGAGWLPDSIAGRVQNLGDYFGGPDPALVEITDENFSVLERLAHWRAGWLMFEASPWLGVGIGNYAINYGRFSLPYWYEPLGHAHNVFVNILAETGALGLGAFLAFWLALAWQLARSAWKKMQPWSAALAIGLIGTWAYLTVHNLFDNLFVQHLQLQLALLLAALSAAQEAQHEW